MTAFDLNLISLYRINGQEWPLLPGLLALNPPRKTARGREQDRLLVYLTLVGNVIYSSAEYAEITAQVANQFYSTSGSLTFALKTAVESLNTYLVERNMKTTGGGQYSVGALALAALRGNLLYVTQSGPTHVYWQTKAETRHFNDATLAGKGLGLSQTAHMYFSQATLNSGDRLLFCAALPPNWDKSLSEERSADSLDFMRRRLLAITDTNVSAVLFQVVDGNGAINILRPSKDIPVEVDQQPASIPQPQPANQLVSTPPASTGLPVSRPPLNQPTVAPVASDQPSVVSGQSSVVRPPSSVAPRQEYSPEPKVLITPEQREKLKTRLRASARFLAQSIQAGRALKQKTVSAAEKMIPRLLPGSDESPIKFSGAVSAFMALALAVIVIAVAMTFYFTIGVAEQYKSDLNKALAAAAEARNETDPTKLRFNWQASIDWLDKADQHQVADKSKSQQARQDAQNALDSLDRILRVDYKLAFNTALSHTLSVRQMAASDIDLYLLDDTSGSVIRGTLNGRYYDIDPIFTCKPGTYNGVKVRSLIQIIALPRSNPSGATLLGIDANGNLLYCVSGETPKAVALQAPDTGWNHITGMAYDANNLYVLDSPARAVWVFFGTGDIQFPDKPYFFFESQVPNGLEDTISMSVNADDLYLLYKDGHLTTCTLSRIDSAPTRCTDPSIFVDTRPGFQSGVTLPDVIFTEMTFTSPPDPAIAFLEPYTQSVFRFSARALELQNQIRPAAGKDNPLPENAEITATAFSPNKVLFIFVGGQVYFAVNIP